MLETPVHIRPLQILKTICGEKLLIEYTYMCIHVLDDALLYARCIFQRISEQTTYLPDAMIVLFAFPSATKATPTGMINPAPPSIFRPHVCKN